MKKKLKYGKEISDLKAKLGAQEEEIGPLRAIAEAAHRWNSSEHRGLGECGNSDTNILRHAVEDWRWGEKPQLESSPSPVTEELRLLRTVALRAESMSESQGEDRDDRLALRAALAAWRAGNKREGR